MKLERRPREEEARVQEEAGGQRDTPSTRRGVNGRGGVKGQERAGRWGRGGGKENQLKTGFVENYHDGYCVSI